VTIRPAKLLPVGGDVDIAFLWCDRCIPPWTMSYIPIQRPPWSVVYSQAGNRFRCPGNRFRCPGCQGAVRWHVHGPTWRPFGAAVN
jgi:hypothetical protein